MGPAGSPGAGASAFTRVTAPQLSATDAGRLDREIAGLWFLVADFDAAMASPQRARFDTAENWRRYAGSASRASAARNRSATVRPSS